MVVVVSVLYMQTHTYNDDDDDDTIDGGGDGGGGPKSELRGPKLMVVVVVMEMVPGRACTCMALGGWTVHGDG